MRLSIIIPCYNEEKNIPLILKKFAQAISREDMEVVLVDNGSTDGTQEILERILPGYPFARSLCVPVNQGYGNGILQGLNTAIGEFVGWTHADMQTDPADVIRAYQLLERESWDPLVFIKGNRKKRKLAERFFTAGMGIFESVYLGKRLFDVNAQPNIFSRAFFQTWENPPADFALDLYALYMAQLRKLRIVRFDVLFPPRIHGSSHWNTSAAEKWRFIRRTVDFSIRLKREGIR